MAPEISKDRSPEQTSLATESKLEAGRAATKQTVELSEIELLEAAEEVNGGMFGD
jgi:hypothetical protein